MYTIKTKNTGYTGVISGIAFSNGIAKVEELSKDDIAWFKSYGHTVEKEKNEEISVETMVEEKETETKSKKGK